MAELMPQRGDVVTRVENLRVDLPSGDDILDEVSFSVHAGEVVALVGESGSGKTTVSMALLAIARRGARIAGGTVEVLGRDVLALDERERRSIRGSTIAYVPQDPAAALNPSLRIRRQLTELIDAHQPEMPSDERDARVVEVLGEVGLPTDDAFQSRFPHQLSGGQQQRVGIAMAILLKAEMIVFDEPTTGLDVTTQAKILATVRRLCKQHDIGVLYVTHDLSVVADIADRVIVMYSGRIVEVGTVGDVFSRPCHPYTQALFAAVPDVHHRTELVTIPGSAARPGRRPDGCFFHPRCPVARAECRTGVVEDRRLEPDRIVRCLRADEERPAAERVAAELGSLPDTQPILEVRNLRAFYGQHEILHDVSFTLQPGECLALVGESGSGKSTLSRCVIGLHRDQRSEIVLHGHVLAPTARSRSKELRRSIQYIFQSPHNSLNPRKTVGQTVGLAHEMFYDATRRERAVAVAAALEHVGLAPSLATAFPDELSGGERQRVGIARALVCKPEVLICDEITSALDVSVQAAIIDLLRELQVQDQLAMLFVTHDLALVRNVAHRVMVLNGGHIVESGRMLQVLGQPDDPYTRQLLADTPSVERRGGAEAVPAGVRADLERPAADGG